MPTKILRETHLTTEKLLEQVAGYFSPEDFVLLKRACAFAEEYYAHIAHPIGKAYILYAAEVASKLHELHADPTLISAAMVNPPPSVDVRVLDDLEKTFKDKYELVKLVEEIHRFDRLEWNAWSTFPEQNETKEGRERKEILQKMFFLAIDENDGEHQEQISQPALHFQKKEKQAENLIRMFFMATTDIRALIFKLVDRLHFIELLKNVLPAQQEVIHSTQHAKITLGIYAPLADRLGLWRIKSELEDLSFRLLQPYNYKGIANQLEAKKDERKKHINDIIPIIRAQIESFGIQAEVSGRAKHIYSIYQKMEAKQLDFEEINDLLGIRIIVETKEDCYNVQGILHEYWLPITDVYDGKAGRDWIARPKENKYQSLHTTISIEGKAVEVQIRTHYMHEIAEYGASTVHWRYKESKTYRKGKIPRVIRTKDQVWNELLAELRKHLSSLQDFAIPMFKSFAKYWTFVITPEGHVINLPAGATPLDFAYRIHTELGHRYAGAKVDGRIVRLDYTLKNGDIVELITSRARKGPSAEWLSKSRLDDELKSDEVFELLAFPTRKGFSSQWFYKDESDYSYYVFARTRRARSKIRHWFNMQKNKEQS